jgi:hypothetical protein
MKCCNLAQTGLDEDTSLFTRRNALEAATNCLEVLNHSHVIFFNLLKIIFVDS